MITSSQFHAPGGRLHDARARTGESERLSALIEDLDRPLSPTDWSSARSHSADAGGNALHCRALDAARRAAASVFQVEPAEAVRAEACRMLGQRP